MKDENLVRKELMRVKSPLYFERPRIESQPARNIRFVILSCSSYNCNLT